MFQTTNQLGMSHELRVPRDEKFGFRSHDEALPWLRSARRVDGFSSAFFLCRKKVMAMI